MILNLLEKIAKSLEEKKIPYMLSGSIALNTYTIPRMTLDVDIIIELHEENLQNFLSIFDENYYLNKNTVNEEMKNSGMFNVIDHETGFKVDFILRKNTEYRKHEFLRKKKTKIADFYVWMVTKEDLVISKIEWIQEFKSDKQVNDIKHLLSISNIDNNYIKKWLKKMNLKTYNLI